MTEQKLTHTLALKEYAQTHTHICSHELKAELIEWKTKKLSVLLFVVV